MPTERAIRSTMRVRDSLLALLQYVERRYCESARDIWPSTFLSGWLWDTDHEDDPERQEIAEILELASAYPAWARQVLHPPRPPRAEFRRTDLPDADSSPMRYIVDYGSDKAFRYAFTVDRAALSGSSDISSAICLHVVPATARESYTS